MNGINLLQWPAMVVTIAAAWLVASESARRRNSGFWVFLLSNVLWTIWAVYAAAPALIALQLGLATMNIRGAVKTAGAKRRKSTTAETDRTTPPIAEGNANAP
jgi:hypothetical protein